MIAVHTNILVYAHREDSDWYEPAAEDKGYWQDLKLLVNEVKITGAQIHDARIAALCLRGGVRELWSADRDFSRFPQLSVQNPLLGDRKR